MTDAGPDTLVVGADGPPTRIQSAGSHINLGDVVLSTTFADYAEIGGLQLPTQITTQVDDFTTGTYQVSNRSAATGEPIEHRRRQDRGAAGSPGGCHRPRNWRPAPGCSPASRITACSWTSPITSR